jgi:hypothetical protein
MFQWNGNLAKAYAAMVFEFNNNRHEIERALSDFETCGVIVPPEIYKLMEVLSKELMG